MEISRTGHNYSDLPHLTSNQMEHKVLGLRVANERNHTHARSKPGRKEETP